MTRLCVARSCACSARTTWIPPSALCACERKRPRTGANVSRRIRLRPVNYYAPTLTSVGHSAEPLRPLFLSISRRNRAAAITPWTWSKVVRGVAVRSGVLRFSTHTLRHLCLTDLARAGWELHAIATFAGHRSLATTLQYIHLSGRELADKLARGMAEVHAWRIAQIDEVLGEPVP